MDPVDPFKIRKRIHWILVAPLDPMDPLVEPLIWIHWIHQVEHPLEWMLHLTNGSNGSIWMDPLVDLCSGSNGSIGHPVDSPRWIHLSGSTGSSMDPVDPLDPPEWIQWIHSDGSSGSSGSICQKQHPLEWMIHLNSPMGPSEWIHWMSSALDPLDGSTSGSTGIQWMHLRILNGSSGSISGYTGSI